MEIDLQALLEQYNDYTIQLITCLEQEDYDLLNHLMSKRQEILDMISIQSYDKELLSKILNELELIKYEQKLADLLFEKRDKVKDKINTLVKSKNASNMYYKNVTGSAVFSKKI